MLLKIKQFFDLHKKALFAFILSLSGVFCILSYAVGYCNFNSRLDSFLFELDYIAKSQPNYSYLDTLSEEQKNKQESYKYLRIFTTVVNSNDNKQDSYDLFRQYSTNCFYNSSNRMYTGCYGIGDLNGFYSFSVNSGVDNCSWTESNILGVGSDYNSAFISYLGLPLFSNSMTHRNTATPKNGADCGTIVSFSSALAIVESKGILTLNNGDVRKSIEQLINDESYTFTINVNDRIIKCSISDVYIDNNGIQYLSSEQLTRATNVYRNYEVHFGQWNNNGIFIFNPSLFKSNQLVFAFDVYRNYGNFKAVFSIIGNELQNKNIDISIFKKISEEPVSFLEIDKTVLDYVPSSIFVVFLYISLIFIFVALCSLYIYSAHKLFLTKRDFSFLSMCLGMPFFIFQLMLYIFIATEKLRFIGFLMINSVGNLIILLAVFGLIGCGITFYIRRRKKYAA